MCTFVRGRWVSCQKSKAPKSKSKTKNGVKHAVTTNQNLRPMHSEV